MLDVVLPQARKFAEQELDAAATDRAGEIGDQVIARAAHLGLFGLTIPEEYGGIGLSLGDATRVVAEIARADRSVACMIGLHAGLGTRGIVELGTEQVRRTYLPALASGERIGAFCATEPEAGSDLSRVRTTATVVGDQIEVNGEKSYVTNGRHAGAFTVLARTPHFGGARGTALVCIPADTRGISIGKEENKLGLRGSSTVTVLFDGVRAPVENVLGTPGRGTWHAGRVLEWGRVMMAAGCIGTARAALDYTLAHVTRRRQFGRPIGSFGATKAHVAWMATRLWAMEALLDWVCEQERELAPIGLPSSIAKVFCSEGAFDACDRAVQLHGALGYLEDTGVAQLLRDCRVTRIFEGANDVLLVHAGAALVGGSDACRRAHHSAARSLLVPAAYWTTLDVRLTRATEIVRREHGVSAVNHQLVLTRLARAHAALTAASACLKRAGREPSDDEARLAEAALSRLHGEAEKELGALERAEDDERRDDVVMRALGEGAPRTRPEGGAARAAAARGFSR